MSIHNRGINLVEIMIAIGLISILIVPMISLLYSMQGMRLVVETVWVDKFLSMGETNTFNLKDVMGKKSCRNFNWKNAEVTVPQTNLIQRMGTSSLPTAIGILGEYLIVTTNSSSTTLPDFFVLDTNLGVVSALDIGPGIADMNISGFIAYVADTSVKDQAKAIDIYDPVHPVVVKTFTFPGSNSVTSPIAKRLIAYGSRLIIGTEKSTLPEIESFDLKTGALIQSINTDFGINRLFAMGDKLVVLGPTDPEINVYDSSFQKVGSYDAPGGSGNGRSIDVVGERLIFGRTKGGNELNILKSLGDISNALESQKLSASIDNIIADIGQVMVFTSDSLRELMIFEPTKDLHGNIDGLTKVSEFNLPARTADAVCVGSNMYVVLQSSITPLILIKQK